MIVGASFDFRTAIVRTSKPVLSDERVPNSSSDVTHK